MKCYDWIVVGGGFTGATLGYELQKQGFSVLLLEEDRHLDNATRYSYGGLAYWSGTSALTRQLCEEGIACHRQLSEELEADTEFRELTLLLTIAPKEDPKAIAAGYEKFAIAPQLLSVREACEVEPLLNPSEIGGALHLPHGHIHPAKTNQAYLQALQRLGGEFRIEGVTDLIELGDRVVGVKTPRQDYFAEKTAICAGGLSRELLKAAGIDAPLYFTHAEIVEIPSTDFRLSTLVIPATQQRFTLEAQASRAETAPLWDRPNCELASPILDASAVQFRDGRLCLGQLSRTLADPHSRVDGGASEAKIRSEIAQILPALADLPGTWHHCLVAFSNNSLPLVGALAPLNSIYLFSGFTNTLIFAPPLAKRFARWAAGESDRLLAQLAFNP